MPGRRARPVRPPRPDGGRAQARRAGRRRDPARGPDHGRAPGALRRPRLCRGGRRDPLRRVPPLRRPGRVRPRDEGRPGRGQRRRPVGRRGHPGRADGLQPRDGPRDDLAGLRPRPAVGPLRSGDARAQARRPLQPEQGPAHGLRPAQSALELQSGPGRPQEGRFHRDVGRRRPDQERSRPLSALPPLPPEGAGHGLPDAADRLRRRKGVLLLPELLLGHGPEHGRHGRRRLLSRPRHRRRAAVPLPLPGRDEGRHRPLLFRLQEGGGRGQPGPVLHRPLQPDRGPAPRLHPGRQRRLPELVRLPPAVRQQFPAGPVLQPDLPGLPVPVVAALQPERPGLALRDLLFPARRFQRLDLAAPGHVQRLQDAPLRPALLLPVLVLLALAVRLEVPIRSGDGAAVVAPDAQPGAEPALFLDPLAHGDDHGHGQPQFLRAEPRPGHGRDRRRPALHPQRRRPRSRSSGPSSSGSSTAGTAGPGSRASSNPTSPTPTTARPTTPTGS